MSTPQYYRPSAEAARSQQKQADKINERKFNNTEVDFENGVTVFRILPAVTPDGFITRLKSMWFKGNIGWTCINDGALPVITDMWPTQGLDDPIMRVIERLKGLIDTTKLQPGTPRFITNALILRHTPEHGTVAVDHQDWYVPKILRLPKKGNDWIINRISDPNFGDLTDPERGFWLGCTKTGQGLDTKYDWNIYPNLPQKITEDPALMRQILSGIQDLHKYAPPPSGPDMDKQHAVADELLRRYNLHGRPAAAMGIQSPGYAPAPSLGSIPTVGAPMTPQAPTAIPGPLPPPMPPQAPQASYLPTSAPVAMPPAPPSPPAPPTSPAFAPPPPPAAPTAAVPPPYNPPPAPLAPPTAPGGAPTRPM